MRDTLSRLQIVYAQQAGGGTGPAPGAEAPPQPARPEAPGTAQSSGRLWIPGQ